jgi:hypothetical protein
MTRNVRAGADRRFWHAAWSGRRCTVHRRRQLPIDLGHPAVSILGALPPEAIGPALAGDGGGMAGRCLFAWPQRPAWQPLSAAAGLDNAHLEASLEALLALPDERRDVPLAGAALAAFEDFRQWHRAQADGLDGCNAVWWSHGPGTVLRLAGVLTFLGWAAGTDEAEPADIPAWAIGSAVALWRDYLWPHARAVLRHAGGSERQRRLEKVQRWLLAKHLAEVSREQIRREALSQKVDAAGADAIIAALVAAGWLRLAGREKGGPGRPADRWLVNPMIGSLHALDGLEPESGARATLDQKARQEAVEPVSAIPATPPVEAPADIFALPPLWGSVGEGGTPSSMPVAGDPYPRWSPAGDFRNSRYPQCRSRHRPSREPDTGLRAVSAIPATVTVRTVPDLR